MANEQMIEEMQTLENEADKFSKRAASGGFTLDGYLDPQACAMLAIHARLSQIVLLLTEKLKEGES